MRFPAGRLAVFMLALFVAFGAFAVYRYREPLPPLTVTQLLPESSVPVAAASAVPWPRSGAAALAVDRIGLIGSNGDDRMRPIASVTKMMTAYVVLKGHPLRPGERGPEVRITAEDIRNYNRHLAMDNSVVPVAEGQLLSQYDLMQALLIASGNNIADLLARWDAGTIEAFVMKMNAEAAAFGMTKTRYADTNGTSAQSMSTASDQLVLAQTLMTNPVFAEIVGRRQAQIPGAGTIMTTNVSLGRAGIVGVKTGWTEEAGGCLVFAANVTVDGRPVTLFGAVIGESDRPNAFSSSERLATAVAAGLRFTKVLPASTPVLNLESGWGSDAQAVAAADVEALVWPGMAASTQVELLLPSAVPIQAGAEVGRVVVSYGAQRVSVPLKAQARLDGPGLGWRVLR